MNWKICPKCKDEFFMLGPSGFCGPCSPPAPAPVRWNKPKEKVSLKDKIRGVVTSENDRRDLEDRREKERRDIDD